MRRQPRTRWCVNARHASKPQNQKMFWEAVNNCEHPLVVLVLCVFGTCRAFVVPAEVFSHMVSSCRFFQCTRVCFSQGFSAFVCAVSSFDFDVPSFARLVRYCPRDRRCDNNHRHHIESIGYAMPRVIRLLKAYDEWFFKKCFSWTLLCCNSRHSFCRIWLYKLMSRVYVPSK